MYMLIIVSVSAYISDFQYQLQNVFVFLEYHST